MVMPIGNWDVGGRGMRRRLLGVIAGNRRGPGLRDQSMHNQPRCAMSVESRCLNSAREIYPKAGKREMQYYVHRPR